jgi:hypothetical protein
MPASPDNRPKRRAKRARTPLAMLAALCALAAPAALAPTPAAAVINNQGTSGCAAPHPGDQVFWNNGSWCVVQEGAGGTGGTGTAPGGSAPGLFYWASSDAPDDLLADCLHNNAGTCMPVQRGGRGVPQEIKDGPGARGQRGSGSKAAGKSETGRGKPKPKPTPKEECLELGEVGLIWSPPEVLKAKRVQRSALRLKIGELGFDLAVARKNERLGHWDPVAVATIKSKIGGLVREAEAVEDEIGAVSKAREQWEKKNCAHLLYDV